MSRPPRNRVSAILHWSHAGVLVGLFLLGWVMVGLPKGPDKAAFFATHKSLGITAMLLLAGRLAWRIGKATRSRRPAAPLVSLHHALLYVLLLLTPLFGYLSTAFGRYPVRFFGFDLPKLASPDEALSRFFAACHNTSGWVLLALVLIHLATAIRSWRQSPEMGPSSRAEQEASRENVASGVQ